MNLLHTLAAKLAGLPIVRKIFVRLGAEPANQSSALTASRIQGALRSAENGDPRNLFAIYRDMCVAGSHVQTEFSKRKLAVLAQPFSILPVDPKNADDIKAAEAVRAMVAACDNWTDGLTYLLDASMYPVTAAQKVFAANDDPTIPLRYVLRRIEPVSYSLLCFRPPATAALRGEWEPDLRFWSTDPEGNISIDAEKAYAADRNEHVIHRGHLLVGVRDTWGGPMRAVLFWWYISTLIRDWWARASERFGSPFPVGYTDATNADAVALLQDAFELSTKIGGMVVDNSTKIELVQAATQGMADNFERFFTTCNREISKIILGQTLSGEAQSTGLGSGTSSLQSDVREDIRMFDQSKLGETLRRQLFEHFLRINGLRGQPPRIVWGGLSDDDAKTLAELIEILGRGGFEPTDEAIPTLQDRIGFQIQRKAAPPAPAPFPGSPPPGSPRRAATSGEGTDEETNTRGNGETESEDDDDPKLSTLNAQLSTMLPARLKIFSAQNAMADRLGVKASWLAPLRGWIEDIQQKTADGALSDAELQRYLDQAIAKMPELFAQMDVAALADVLEAGMGQAVIEGAKDGIRKQR
jgi:hypothetical protein